MYLTDLEISEGIVAGDLQINPYDSTRLRGCAYTLSLCDRFIHDLGSETVDPQTYDPSVLKSYQTDSIIIAPGQFVLAATQEYIGITTTYAAILYNLSHIARLGIAVTHGASLISPGFGVNSATRLTLEIVNHSRLSVILRSGMPICYIAFTRLNTRSRRSYDEDCGVYSNQESPIGSRYADEYGHPGGGER